MTDTIPNSERYERVLKDIDAANADDPRRVSVDGSDIAYEQLYSRRMHEALARTYPNASEDLRIAAYAQHLRRWDLPRDSYPLGKEGYNKWRRAAREHHSKLVTDFMEKHGYEDERIAQVTRLIKKEQLKKDKDSQALENIVGIVFLEHYFDDFARDHADYSDDKMIDILGKTLKKMSPKGHQAALALPLDDTTRNLIERAIEKEKDALEKLAELNIDD